MILEFMLGLALSSPADPSLECPRTNHLAGYPEDSAVIILDGEILGSSADFSGTTVFTEDTLEPSDVARLEHRCWDPDTGALPATREGVDPGLAGYSIQEAEMGWRITSSDIDGLACSASQLGRLNNEVCCTFAYPAVEERLREAWNAGSWRSHQH